VGVASAKFTAHLFPALVIQISYMKFQIECRPDCFHLTIVLLSYINSRGVKPKILQTVLTVIKIIVGWSNSLDFFAAKAEVWDANWTNACFVVT
jgi:APA family basic amino acid/polyamine antiporter